MGYSPFRKQLHNGIDEYFSISKMQTNLVRNTIGIVLYLPFRVLGPEQGLPPGPGAGRLQYLLKCLTQLRLHLPN